MTLPLFPVTGVGSLPRSKSVLKALRQKQKGEVALEELDRIADEAVLAALRLQDEAWSSTSLATANNAAKPFLFLYRRAGCWHPLDDVGRNARLRRRQGRFRAFAQCPRCASLCLEDYPVVVGPCRARQPLALNDYRFLRQHTDTTDQSDVARAVSVDSFDVGEKPLGRVLSR